MTDDLITYSDDKKTLFKCDRNFQGHLVIPDTVTCIAKEAFRWCSGLTSIEIPNSVTTIGGNAFTFCSALTSIKIPNSVTSIGDWAFCRCSALTSIEIPNSVTSIGNNAFRGCSALTSIKIPNSVTSIGDGAFCRCSALTSIEIPNSVTSIGNNAFRGCSALTSIKIPNSVTSIGDWAFCGCSALTSIEIPNSVTSIGGWAFAHCGLLTSIEIPNSVENIKYAAFYQCYISAKNIKNSFNHDLSFPGLNICDVEQYRGLLIKGTEVVFCNKQVTAIEIPNSVTSIGDWAFCECSALTSIEIPNSVTSIGNNAFDGCSALTSIEIPNSVTSIGDRAFYNCNALTNIEIPNSVTSIGNEVFQECRQIHEPLFNAHCFILLPTCFTGSYVIPDGIKQIVGFAFYGCSALTNIKIPNSVTSIGDRAFSGCKGLTSIKMPDSVTEIGERAFYDCKSLTSIEIPNSWIGHDTFEGCTNLKYVRILESVELISHNVYCHSSLEEIKVVDNNPNYKSIDGVLFSKDGSQLIKYPESKKGSCYVVPESANEIGYCAIINNSISKIFLPNINVLYWSAIRIAGIVDVYIKEEHPENIEFCKDSWVGVDYDYIFVGKGSTLYVPIGTGYAYRHHPAFSRFEKVVPINFDKLNVKEVFGDCCTDEDESDVGEKDFNKRNRHERDGRLNYDADKHQYSVDGKILSNVTTVASSIFKPFDEDNAYGTAKKLHITKREVLDMWEKKRNDSAEAGTLMHKKIEEYYDGKDFEDDDTMVLFRQFTTSHQLNPYRTEWAIYDKELNIAGTLDMLDCTDGKYTLYDWKRTDKLIADGHIVKCGYKNQCALPPFAHIPDCSFYRYALQTSIYRFILERKYGLTIEGSKLVVLHPSYNKPYVIDVPYLKEDVEKLLNMRKGS